MRPGKILLLKHYKHLTALDLQSAGSLILDDLCVKLLILFQLVFLNYNGLKRTEKAVSLERSQLRDAVTLAIFKSAIW